MSAPLNVAESHQYISRQDARKVHRAVSSTEHLVELDLFFLSVADSTLNSNKVIKMKRLFSPVHRERVSELWSVLQVDQAHQ